MPMRGDHYGGGYRRKGATTERARHSDFGVSGEYHFSHTIQDLRTVPWLLSLLDRRDLPGTP